MLSADFIATNITAYNRLNFVTQVYIWALCLSCSWSQVSYKKLFRKILQNFDWTAHVPKSFFINKVVSLQLIKMSLCDRCFLPISRSSSEQFFGRTSKGDSICNFSSCSSREYFLNMLKLSWDKDPSHFFKSKIVYLKLWKACVWYYWKFVLSTKKTLRNTKNKNNKWTNKTWY